MDEFLLTGDRSGLGLISVHSHALFFGLCTRPVVLLSLLYSLLSKAISQTHRELLLLLLLFKILKDASRSFIILELFAGNLPTLKRALHFTQIHWYRYNVSVFMTIMMMVIKTETL